MPEAGEKINFTEITVVVQGPVTGLPTDKPRDRYTQICLQSVRRFLPGARIILSTWEGSDTDGLDFDELLLNKDPGGAEIGGGPPNVFRHIASSINGLRQCRTKYAFKLRSDFVLKGTGFLDYFVRFNRLPFDPDYKMLEARVAILTSIDPRRRTGMPFQFSDMFLFGLAEDLVSIFSAPLNTDGPMWRTDPKTGGKTARHYSGEQYIWYTLFSRFKRGNLKHNTDATAENIEASERFCANNCILLTAGQAQMDWLKFSGASYAQVPCLSNNGLYTFTQYKRLLNKYANCRLLIIPNWPEDLVYFIVYNLRFFVRGKNPRLHDFIARLIHPENHRRADAVRARERQQAGQAKNGASKQP